MGDAAQHGKVLLASGHRLKDLRVRLFVNDSPASVFDLHRRLQGHCRVAIADVRLTLPFVDVVRLGEYGRTVAASRVIGSLAPSSERLGDVGIA